MQEGNTRMKNSKVALRDVAARAGVSVSAVSMILSSRKGVTFNEETVRRVRKAAAELGYRRPAGTGLSDRPTIAVFLTIVTGSYYTFIAQSITQKANEAGYDTFILETHHNAERELRLMHMVRRMNIAGILYTAAPINRDEAARIAAVIPTVIIQSAPGTANIDAVTNDTFRVGRLAAEHMLSLGHRYVAYIGIDRTHQQMPGSVCLQGVKSRFSEANDAHLSVYTAPGPDTLVPGSFHETRSLAAELTKKALLDTQITGFICVSDYAAYGVMDTLSEAGMRIPEDYSVCGCNNLFSSSLTGVSLTSVDRHPIDLGSAAFELLHNRMQDAGSGPATITNIEYLSRLIIRGSTGKPRDTAPDKAGKKLPLSPQPSITEEKMP